MEIEPKYVDVSLRRWADFTAEEPNLVEGQVEAGAAR